jgi:hypothetical protein
MRSDYILGLGSMCCRKKAAISDLTELQTKSPRKAVHNNPKSNNETKKLRNKKVRFFTDQPQLCTLAPMTSLALRNAGFILPCPFLNHKGSEVIIISNQAETRRRTS